MSRLVVFRFHCPTRKNSSMHFDNFERSYLVYILQIHTVKQYTQLILVNILFKIIQKVAAENFHLRDPTLFYY